MPPFEFSEAEWNALTPKDKVILRYLEQVQLLITGQLVGRLNSEALTALSASVRSSFL